MPYSIVSHILPILQTFCPEVDIVFQSTAEVTPQVTANNIGGRNGSTDMFAMITNVGFYNRRPLHLKLESALPNGIDPNCSPGLAANQASCSISINSKGAVDFFVEENRIHPIRFTFIDAFTGNQITPLPRFSFSVFDVGNSGRGV